ncbi:MAG: ferritin-like domain-containing protein [Myxococcales bacterium]|nr:ferritin-like domain-containing protein [Myxococcales bacterium]
MSQASDRVKREWQLRVKAEYRSAAFAHNLVLWIIQLGLSPDLIRDGLRVVEDELAHAEMSHNVYVAAGGREAPALDRSALGVPRNPRVPLELDLVVWGTRLCLGETVAVRLFAHLRQGCTVAIAHDALERILRDEVRHRQFGWDLLGLLLEIPTGHQVRKAITAWLPSAFSELERSYGAGAHPVASQFQEEDRAWGLAAPEEYARVFEEAFEKDFRPRFAGLGIDPRSAWATRRELAGHDWARAQGFSRPNG